MKRRQKNKLMKQDFHKAAVEKAAFLKGYYDVVIIKKIEGAVGYKVITKDNKNTTVHMINKAEPHYTFTWSNGHVPNV